MVGRVTLGSHKVYGSATFNEGQEIIGHIVDLCADLLLVGLSGQGCVEGYGRGKHRGQDQQLWSA